MMTKKLDDVQTWLVIFSASIGAVVVPEVGELLTPSFGPIWTRVFLFASFCIALGVLQAGVEGLLTKSQRIRRFLTGKDFIEGVWLDFSHDENEAIVSASIVFIGYSGGCISMNGIGVHSTKPGTASWNSRFAVVHGSTLAYAWESHTPTPNSPIEMGYGELKFVMSNGVPRSYTGFFFDATHQKLATLEGMKLLPKSLPTDLEDPAAREGFLRDQLRKRIAASSG